MLQTLFQGLFDTTTQVISVSDFLLCIATALVTGLIFAGVYVYKARPSKSFVATLALLPAVVCVVIMTVNGNVGAGVAVAGAFSLVRFRSVPGTAKEIGALFMAMAAGLIAGMGYLAYSVLFALVLGGVFLLYQALGHRGKHARRQEKLLRITVPEDLDYTGVFDDVFTRYTLGAETVSVKTTNMGSLFKLTYRVTLRDAAEEKAMIDALRCRNGNLEISLSQREENQNEL